MDKALHNKQDRHPLPFRRILLKISGEALMGNRPYGIDITMTDRIAREVKQAREQHGVEICLVIGGAIFSGASRPQQMAWTVPQQIIWACWLPL